MQRLLLIDSLWSCIQQMQLSDPIIMDLAHNWILMAMLTPAVWAIACLLDSCLVGRNIYRHPSDGTVVTCLFCVIPVVLVLLWSVLGWPSPGWNDSIGISALPSVTDSWSAAGAGIAFTVHIFFYFRILFQINDVSGAETIVALSVLIVPVFSWWLLDEVLPVHYYAAFILAALGVTLHCLPVLRRLGWKLLFNMLVCLLAVSLAMVLQAQALMNSGFAASTITFNTTCVAIAVLALMSHQQLRQRVARIFRRFFELLIITEVLGILALVCSHRATQLSPSVSLVALIECLLPLIIIAFSLLLITINRFVPVFSTENQKILALQITRLPSKVIALSLLLVSVGAVSF